MSNTFYAARGATAVRPTAQQFTNSLWFNGTSTVVGFGRPASMANLGDFTFSAWINPGSRSKQVLWSNCFSYVGDQGKQVCIDGGTNGRLQLFQGNGNTISGVKGTVMPGTWQHIAVTQTGTTVTFYYNGVQASATTGFLQKTSANLNAYLGAENGGGFLYKGGMANIGVWNRALSAAERSELYHNDTVPTSGLVSYHSLNEGQGTSAADSSGNNNTGTITGGTWGNDPAPHAILTKYNLVTNPSFEASGFWTQGQAGDVTGIAYSLADTSRFLFGTRSARFESKASSAGQYYLTNSAAFSPIVGRTYTLSAYVYMDASSGATGLKMGFRDWPTYNFLNVKTFTIIPGRWQRIWVTYTATAANPTWRLTIADSGGTSTQGVFYVDGTMLEYGDGPSEYFDGSVTGAQWQGTANASISTKFVPRAVVVS